MNSDWLQNFRVSRATFLYLCSELEPGIAKKRTRFRTPISVSKASCNHTLGVGNHNRYHTVAHLFGVARCTVCCIVQET